MSQKTVRQNTNSSGNLDKLNRKYVATVTLVKAKNLFEPKKGICDPYCLLSVCSSGKILLKTKVIKQNRNPEWNEFIKMGLSESQLKEKLRVDIWHHNTFSKDVFLGYCDFNFLEVPQDNTEYEPTLDLIDISTGKLVIKLTLSLKPESLSDERLSIDVSRSASSSPSKDRVPVPKNDSISNGDSNRKEENKINESNETNEPRKIPSIIVEAQNDKESLEKERIEREERERKEKEEREKEEREKLKKWEKEVLEKGRERERLERERIESLEKERKEREKREKKEKEEKERQEKERLEKIEKEILEKEAKDRIERERIEKEEKEKKEKKKWEKQIFEKEKEDKEKLEREIKEKEKLEKEKLEKEKLEKEKERELLEKEKLEKEKSGKEKEKELEKEITHKLKSSSTLLVASILVFGILSVFGFAFLKRRK